MSLLQEIGEPSTGIEIVDKKSNLELKKHVGLIHCSNKLTLLQRKISNALLYNAYGNLLTQKYHTISISKLISIIGYCSNDYLSIKKSVMVLISTVLEWNLLKDKAIYEKDNIWIASSMLSSVRIEGANIHYSYSDELKNLLFMPEIYGRINLVIQSKFKSSYSLALYENCVRYRNVKSTSWIPINVFRKLMGVQESKYIVFRDLKRKVVDKAASEINNTSDIFISYEVKRAHQKVEFIKFSIQNNDNYNVIEQVKLKNISVVKQELDNEALSGEMYNSLICDFRLSKKQSMSILTQYSHEYISNKMALIRNHSSYKNKQIGNLAAYLVSALKNDYTIPTTMTDNRTDNLFEGLNKQPSPSQILEYQIYLENQLWKDYEGISDEIKLGFLQSIENEDNGYLSKTNTKTLGSVVAAKKFLEFLKKNYPTTLGQYESFDEYIITHNKGVN